MQAGGAPSSTRWLDPAGDEYCLVAEPTDVKAFTAHFAATVRSKQWQAASRHHLGGGLQHGGDLRHAATMIRARRKAGDSKGAGLLLAIVSAGLWPRSRGLEEGCEQARCPMCDQGAEDSVFHRCYECPYVCGQDSAVLRDTESVAAVARQRKHLKDEECFWNRGIIPTP